MLAMQGRSERDFPKKAASFLWVRKAERPSPREQGQEEPRVQSPRREGWWPAVNCGGKGLEGRPSTPHQGETRIVEPPRNGYTLKYREDNVRPKEINMNGAILGMQ